jgi:hypothetical protein
MRWPIGTSYVDIGAALVKLFRRPDFAEGDLIVDGTGARGSIDLLRDAKPNAKLRPVNITGGMAESRGTGGYWNVPKSVLISVTGALLQSKRLRFPEKLEHGETPLATNRSMAALVSTMT